MVGVFFFLINLLILKEVFGISGFENFIYVILEVLVFVNRV